MKKFETKKFLLTNSMSNAREEFKPLFPPKVNFYSCGPTVYGPLHIGNARALITADLLFRWLKYIGYEVNFVRNYTDVDDKIINRSREEKVSSLEVSEKYIEYCEEDIRRLGLSKPTKTVKVTDSMDDIIHLIEKIISSKHAYLVDDEGGKKEVLYDINSFQSYGKLSGKKIDELQAGARVEIDKRKHNPMDFSLWKPAKKDEPFWNSPWGEGRPGWHIECSAMAGRWLGETIDIHHGGQDLIFPHHENEIAQSEAASGKPFCRHWVHNAFLTMGREKMSKSLGNLLTIREFLEGYGAEVLKYIYVSHHIRSTIEFSDELILKSFDELDRIYLVKKWANQAAESEVVENKNDTFFKLIGKAQEIYNKIEDEMFADMNSPGALGHLFTYVREINRTEIESAGKPGLEAPNTISRKTVANEFLNLINNQLNPLWNIYGEEPDHALKAFDRVRGEIRRTGKSELGFSDHEIQQFIVERNAARKSKNFARADEIRKLLDEKGIVLVDTPQGTSWKNK